MLTLPSVIGAATGVASFDASKRLWLLTLGCVLVALLIDLLSHLKPSIPSMKASFWASLGWTAIGLCFGFALWMLHGGSVAAQYFAGYLLERTLSIDNVFVFVLILNFFSVPHLLRHRALLFGVIAALIFRAIFIVLGGALLSKFWWMNYAFGLFLVYTALKLYKQESHDIDPEKNPVLKLMRRIRPVTHRYYDFKLRVREDGILAFTPLFVALMAIGTTDVVFAIDSIPAIFAVTSSTYVVFAANAFALMGLIPLTFLLANAVDRFAYLKHALAIILGYVGVKMFISHHFHIPVLITLVVVVVVLAMGIVFSLYRTRDNGQDATSPT